MLLFYFLSSNTSKKVPNELFCHLDINVCRIFYISLQKVIYYYGYNLQGSNNYNYYSHKHENSFFIIYQTIYWKSSQILCILSLMKINQRSCHNWSKKF